MLQEINQNFYRETATWLSSTSSDSTITEDSVTNDSDESPQRQTSFRYKHERLVFKIPKLLVSPSWSSKSVAVLSDHIASVSCLALCGEIVPSASQGKDIILWQQPDLRQFTKFGQGDGMVKALVNFGNRVFTGHQDRRIRVWKISASSENVFKLADTLPTTMDFLGRFMKRSNYVRTRRHRKRLWIEHADSISCLVVSNGLIYSGSRDKMLKVWRMSDFKCLESIKAHDDAINGLVACNEIIYSVSFDEKIKAWGKCDGTSKAHFLKGILEGNKDIPLNCVVASEETNHVYGGGSDGYVMGCLSNKDSDIWKTVCEVKAHDMAVLCMCLTSDYVMIGSADKSIIIWTRESSHGLFRALVIKGHNGPIKCLQASSVRVGGGFMLYSGSFDKSIRVWWVPNYFDTDKYSIC